MGFKILITDAALNDLREIVEFVALSDPRSAERLGNKLVRRTLGLAEFPERFPFHDPARGIRKMLLNPYLVFYTCDEDMRVVSILHFWHAARLFPEFPG